MKNFFIRLAGSLALFNACFVFGAGNPFAGAWELTVPGGHAGWLGVEEKSGRLHAGMMWAFGSVEPVASASVENDHLVITRNHQYEMKDASGKKVGKTRVETITARLEGDKMLLTSLKPAQDGMKEERQQFAGRRSPPMPPAPNLKEVQFGEPIRIFNGTDLAGWRLIETEAVNGWSARNGLLVNDAVQEEGKPRKSYGNLRTEAEFEDFNLKLEARVQQGGNSGIYLRGIYEVQVADSYGQPPESHRIGAIYSRITPTSNPANPPGEWQSFDITLVDRHVTVILNGQTIIANQPLLGCTGGALWSDVSRPGPIYFQGDHTGVEYRNIVLRPVRH